ncbi:MAG: hypothetical protein H6Q33_2750 [Deltaproteobacteria bacterium]|nr:hypothetical protein [Deltaproteobacteria bacterium]
MRRLFGFMTGILLTAALSIGCGSTGNDDALVLQFIRFDNTGLTQEDSVGETSADVDIVQDVCAVSDSGVPTYEPYTNTRINAVFHNYEASDITLNKIVIDAGPNSGIPVVTHYFTAIVEGGRCLNAQRQQCASDQDCGGASCAHADTTVSGILLLDFNDKAHMLPGTFSVKISFFGTDPNRSFEVRADYVVHFNDFDNCTSSGSGAATT